MDATKRYYRVGGDPPPRGRRTRGPRCSSTGTATASGRDAATLLDSAHARYAIGAVAVPYGTCSEPLPNVKDGGGACPVRLRCTAVTISAPTCPTCPILTGYLDDLLRTRERLAAAVKGIDEWARADAGGREEITRIRRLISKIKGDITQLTDTERAAVDNAVAVGGRSRRTQPG